VLYIRKVRRIVFQRTNKFSGSHVIPLSASQIKQIGGRAGRYGLHGDSSSGGVVTTLHEKDLPAVKTAMETPFHQFKNASLGLSPDLYQRILSVLPTGAGGLTAQEVLMYCSRLPHWLAAPPETKQKTNDQIAFVDSILCKESRADRSIFVHLPFPYSDESVRAVVEDMLRDYCEKNYVDIIEITTRHGLLQALAMVRRSMAQNIPLINQDTELKMLETLHKALVAYVWSHWHWPTAFYAHNLSVSLLRATEGAMDHVLRNWGSRAVFKGKLIRETPRTKPATRRTRPQLL
jgi:ATP-dependent RNA helicase SUPV3L1/SUV3